MENKKIGVVGLGIMGRGMVNNFLNKGYTVFVWNRTASVLTEFESKGAKICRSPAEVAQNADVVFEVTANDESSREVWTGKDGILVGATAKTILIASATLSIDWIDELIKLCTTKNFTFLDIALTGGRIGAETGNLTMLCGGEESVLEGLKPTFDAIATKIFYFGLAGQGMRYKLILNFLQAVHVLGFGEAMKIAKAHGMDEKKVAAALCDRPGGALTAVAEKAYFTEPNPITFSVEWITKDLTYAKKFSEGLSLPFLDDALSEYTKAIEQGLGKKDWASINRSSDD